MWPPTERYHKSATQIPLKPPLMLVKSPFSYGFPMDMGHHQPMTNHQTSLKSTYIYIYYNISILIIILLRLSLVNAITNHLPSGKLT